MLNQIKNVMFVLLLWPSMSIAQEERRSSPLTVVTSHYKDTYIKVVYSQPQRKNRTVFGGLVPFGKVWRTGANEATEITITRDLLVNGQLLSAGTYSLFTIPNQDNWTVIINSDLGLWGSYNYNDKKDVLRFAAPVESLDRPEEIFTIQIDPLNSKAIISMLWEKTKVSFEIQYSEPETKP